MNTRRTRWCEKSERLESQARCNSCSVLMAVSKPPGSVKATVNQLRDGVQQCLSSRVSRMDIELPPDATFGLDKQPNSNATASATMRSAQLRLPQDEIRSREVAQLIAEMFANTGLGVLIAFNDPKLAKAAEIIWPTSSSASSSSSGENGVRLTHAREVSRVVDSSVEVVVCVNPKNKMLVQLKEIVQREGDRVAVLLVNARLATVRWPNKTLQQFYSDSFDTALFYSMLDDREDAVADHNNDTNATSSSSSSGEPTQTMMLYRKFPDDWVLCRKRSLGAPVVIKSWTQRPSAHELQSAQQSARLDSSSSPSNALFDSVTSFFQRK